FPHRQWRPHRDSCLAQRIPRNGEPSPLPEGTRQWLIVPSARYQRCPSAFCSRSFFPPPPPSPRTSRTAAPPRNRAIQLQPSRSGRHWPRKAIRKRSTGWRNPSGADGGACPRISSEGPSGTCRQPGRAMSRPTCSWVACTLTGIILRRTTAQRPNGMPAPQKRETLTDNTPLVIFIMRAAGCPAISAGPTASGGRQRPRDMWPPETFCARKSPITAKSDAPLNRGVSVTPAGFSLRTNASTPEGSPPMLQHVSRPAALALVSAVLSLSAAPALAGTVTIQAMQCSAGKSVPHLRYEGGVIEGDLDRAAAAGRQCAHCDPKTLPDTGGN